MDIKFFSGMWKNGIAYFQKNFSLYYDFLQTVPLYVKTQANILRFLKAASPQ